MSAIFPQRRCKKSLRHTKPPVFSERLGVLLDRPFFTDEGQPMAKSQSPKRGHPRFRRADRLLNRAETIERLRRHDQHHVADALAKGRIVGEDPPVAETYMGEPLYRWGDVCAWTHYADLRLWAAPDGVEKPGSVGAEIAAFAKAHLIKEADPTVVPDPEERARIRRERYLGAFSGTGGIDPSGITWLATDKASATTETATAST